MRPANDLIIPSNHEEVAQLVVRPQPVIPALIFLGVVPHAHAHSHRNTNKQGRILGNPVADGWAGAVLEIFRTDGRTD